MVIVTLQNTLSGEFLELPGLSTETSIRELKVLIERHLHISTQCLKLIINADILGDAELLAAYCTSDHASISMTMLKSWDSSYAYELANGTVSTKLEVLRAIPGSESTVDEGLTCAIVACLEDPDRHVRALAVQTLQLVAQKGSERILSELCARLHHRSRHVRRAAIQSLTNVEDRNSEVAISAVIACADDEDRGVRMAVAKALPRLSEGADERILEALLLLADDQDMRVKTDAVRALGLVAGTGDERFKAAASAHLEGCADWQLRLAAGA